MDPDTPLFKLLTLETVLPLEVSDESIDNLIKHVEASGYSFTVSVVTITAADLSK